MYLWLKCIFALDTMGTSISTKTSKRNVDLHKSGFSDLIIPSANEGIIKYKKALDHTDTALLMKEAQFPMMNKLWPERFS